MDEVFGGIRSVTCCALMLKHQIPVDDLIGVDKSTGGESTNARFTLLQY